MQADEHVCLAVIGDRRAVADRDSTVVVACHQDAQAEPRFDRAFQPPCDCQRHILFCRASRTFRADGVDGTIAGSSDGGGSACVVAGVGAVSGWFERRSITVRAFASATCVDARNDA